jgi:hypothetical protein
MKKRVGTKIEPAKFHTVAPLQPEIHLIINQLLFGDEE